MKKSITQYLLTAAACLVTSLTQAAPPLPADLQLRVTIPLAADLGLPASSTYNPRCFAGHNYVVQINIGCMGIGRYPSGSNIPSVVVPNASALIEHRMLAPFPGPDGSTYMLAGGGANPAGGLITTLSRYDADGANRVDVAMPVGLAVEGFDLVDDNTIIGTIYSSGSRNRLYLMDVTAAPFTVSLNTTWSPDGYVQTGVTTRIRNVRVGDRYPGYAYYGDAGVVGTPNFYAINLATGVQSPLGNVAIPAGTGSFGLWTVLERGGYLYVQTTDNGIQVYNMTDATTLGSLYTTYDKATLDAITGYTGQYYGLDVTPDGTQMLLASGAGVVFELGPPILSIARSGSDVVLSWPNSVNAVKIQAASTLFPSDFADLDPQPAIVVNGKFNTATIPAGGAQTFFRLRKSP